MIIFLVFRVLSKVVDIVQATSAKFLQSFLIVMKCLEQLPSLIKVLNITHTVEAIMLLNRRLYLRNDYQLLCSLFHTVLKLSSWIKHLVKFCMMEKILICSVSIL